MRIGTDQNGKVWFSGNSIPTEWNGLIIKEHELTAEQDAEYRALPSLRGDLYFTDGVFKAEPYVDLVDYKKKRSIEYSKRGVTIEAMTVALFENDAVEIARLEAIRKSVKAEIPKPAEARK